jgi:hypothetical protein
MRKDSFRVGVIFVSSLVEASNLVRAIASPAQVGETIKAQILRASRRIPFWSYSRVHRVWYQVDQTRVDADEITLLRRLAKADQEAIYASREYIELEARLKRLEAAFALSDANIRGPEADEDRPLDAGSRGEDRALD